MSYYCNKCNGKSSIITDIDSGEVICNKCASVLLEKLSSEEIKVESGNSLMSLESHGSPTNYYLADKGLPSKIDSSGRDAYGKPLTSYSKDAFNRLAKWDKRTKSRSYGGMHIALTILEGITVKLGLPEHAKEEASRLFRKCSNIEALKNLGGKKLVAPVIYLTCRRLKIPRTINDVAYAANDTTRSVRKTYRRLINCLGLAPEISDPETLIGRITNSLVLKERIWLDAIAIAREYHETEVSEGKNPFGIASASVYLACLKNRVNLSQSAISQVTGISGVTIRNISESIRKSVPELKDYKRKTSTNMQTDYKNKHIGTSC